MVFKTDNFLKMSVLTACQVLVFVVDLSRKVKSYPRPFNEKRGKMLRNYKAEYMRLLTPGIAKRLSNIHEYKGAQDLFFLGRKNALRELIDIATATSTRATCSMMGLDEKLPTPGREDRLKQLTCYNSKPESIYECEIAGYRTALIEIEQNYEFTPMNISTIEHIHNSIYWSVKEIDEKEEIPFWKVQSFDGESGIQDPQTSLVRLCEDFNNVSNDPEVDSLLLIPMFILDFIGYKSAIEGAERLSWLLLQMLLLRAGYLVGKYVSIEKLISESRPDYEAALSINENCLRYGSNNYEPFVSFILDTIEKAYQPFFDWVKQIIAKRHSALSRVRSVLMNTEGKIEKSRICELCQTLSPKSVERSLKTLMENSEVTKIGGGRYTFYIWNKEQ